MGSLPLFNTVCPTKKPPNQIKQLEAGKRHRRTSRQLSPMESIVAAEKLTVRRMSITRGFISAADANGARGA